jgi:hypothetical protein
MSLKRVVHGDWLVVRHVLLAWIVLFTLAIGYSVRTNNSLIRENKQRIADIQEQRLASCRQTYEGVRQVFLPFFPPPKGRTAAQQKNLDKFNRTVDRLKGRCETQVRIGGEHG